MGLKCSVLGHKYGEATVEREREEQGSEVVITIREQETCERCGNTRIVSENKEVTSIETPSDIAGDVVEAQAESNDTAAGREADDTSVDEATASRSDDAVTPVFEDGSDSAESPHVDPDEDDAEIMETSDDVSSGDAELDEPSTSVDVPDAESDVAEASESEEDDALIIDGEDDSASADDRQPGQWPDEPGDDGDDWKPETVLSDDADAESATPDVEPVSSPAVTVPDGEFHCAECGFTTPVESSSLREGDFCPECHKGSLIQRVDE
jgi:hypothetical protein